MSTLVDTEKLKDAIEANGKTITEVADNLEIDRSTLYRKMKNGNFLIEEVNKMVDFIPLTNTQAIDIFLDGVSHKSGFEELEVL